MWSVINVVCYEGGLLWTWSALNVVCNERVRYKRGLLWMLSVVNMMCDGRVMLWLLSFMNVVSYERAQRTVIKGLSWIWSVMNVLCNKSVSDECGLLWKWFVTNEHVIEGSVVNVVFYECGL